MKLLDLGDWISVSGDIFRTRRGEVTDPRPNTLTLLAKTLRPPPPRERKKSSSEG